MIMLVFVVHRYVVYVIFNDVKLLLSDYALQWKRVLSWQGIAKRIIFLFEDGPFQTRIFQGYFLVNHYLNQDFNLQELTFF
jgi:hypothetical protein